MVSGQPDAFNQFSTDNVVSQASPTDLRLMDVIDYDIATVPEPSTAMLIVPALAAGLFVRGWIRTKV